jgi:hypothetical protein
MADDQYLLPEHEPPWWKRVSAERWISLAALLVALAAAGFTGWYAWDTHQMRLDARRAAEEQSADTRHSRVASERSAEAAERSAKAAEEALRHALEGGRARLSHVLANVSPLTVGERPTADFMLSNSGRGTATEIVQKVWMEVLNADLDQLPHLPAKVLRAGALASNDKIVTGIILPRPLSAQELSDIRSGSKALFVYGDVKYRDEAGKERTLEWCSQYTTDVPTVFGMLPTCRIHNSSQ